MIVTLAAILMLALNRIGWLIANRIREWFFKRDVKRDEQRRERQILDERFEYVNKEYYRLSSEVYELSNNIADLKEELNKKENKKNVKKKKRN